MRNKDGHNLPAGWEACDLGSIVKFQKGKVAKPFSETEKPGYIPYIDIEAFETGRIRRYASAKAATVASNDDVLIVWDGARFGLVGTCSGGALGSTLARLKSPVLERDYLLHFLSFKYGTINSRPRGTGTPHVDPEVLWPLEIGIPPRHEQSRIINKIEMLFAEMDKGEEALRKVQRLLKQYRQSILKAAVTGELTGDWRAVNANRLEHGRDVLDRILKARREKWTGRGQYKEPVPPDTSDLPELPEGWIWASFDQLFKIFGGATPSRRKSHYWNGDIPWVSSGEVAFCRIDDTEEKITKAGYESCSTKLHPVGTVLLAMIGEGKTRGQAAILDIPACNNQNAAAVRVSESPIPAAYVYYYLMGNYERSRLKGQGGNQPALNVQKVKEFALPLTRQIEMEEVVNRIEQVLETCRTVDGWCETELERASSLRQSILKDAFAGRLVPQDPNDEPASELLARIESEKDKLATKSRKKATA